MLTTTVFEIVQHFYHGTENGNVTNAVSACADQSLKTKLRQLFCIKWTMAEHNLKHAYVDERSAKSGEMFSGCRR